MMGKSLPAGRCFLDTNILIYAEANHEAKKQKVALQLINSLKNEQCAVLSTQILQEFCSVSLRKLSMPYDYLRQQLHFYEGFEVVPASPALIEHALDLHQTRSFSFYDALVVAAALAGSCTTLFSEDLNAGESVRGLQIINPFAT